MLELLAILTSIAFCTAWFYRNPARTTPAGGAIYSPADGTVIAVSPVEKGRVPLTRKSGRVIQLVELLGTDVDDRGLLVAIFMSPLDVHVNRAPISGRVVFSKRIPGQHLFMQSGDFEVRNERHTTILQNDSKAVGVVQIAAPIAGCIETYVKPGDIVSAGQPIGRIALGSQVDLLIPRNAAKGLLVSVRSRVKAGETIIASPSKQDTRNRADRSPFARTGLEKLLAYYLLANLTVPAIMLILLRKIRAKLKMTQMHA